VPEGADRVIIQEQVRVEDGAAVFDTPASGGRHIRAAGSDFESGETLLEAGRCLDFRAMVALAAADRDRVRVYRRPRVAILSTGDELVEPGRALEVPGAIAESVSFGVAGLVRAWGGDVVRRARLADVPEALEAAAEAALAVADVVVVTGGASVGERDYARSMFASSGLEEVFTKVAIKPGKPVWVARAGGRFVVGLPGNPTSALVTARLFLAPLLAGLAGRNPDEALAWREAVLEAPLGAVGPRETLERAAGRRSRRHSRQRRFGGPGGAGKCGCPDPASRVGARRRRRRDRPDPGFLSRQRHLRWRDPDRSGRPFIIDLTGINGGLDRGHLLNWPVCFPLASRIGKASCPSTGESHGVRQPARR
jgi:molybdopterin molybdotransferase